MKHASSRVLYAYWDRLRGERAAPERNDLDPAAIRNLLGDVFLLELGSTTPYAVRLAGTRICTLMGQEWKGRSFSDAFASGDQTELFKLLDGVAAGLVPAVAGVSGETYDGRRTGLELMLLPLTHRGRKRARLLGMLAALDSPYWTGLVPIKRLHLASVRHLHGENEAAGLNALAAKTNLLTLGGLHVIPGGRI